MKDSLGAFVVWTIDEETFLFVNVNLNKIEKTGVMYVLVSLQTPPNT